MSLRKTLLQGICSVRTISCFFKHKKMCKLHMLQGVQINMDITYNYFQNVLNHSSCGYAAKTVISKSFFSKWACSFFKLSRKLTNWSRFIILIGTPCIRYLHKTSLELHLFILIKTKN